MKYNILANYGTTKTTKYTEQHRASCWNENTRN